MSALRRELKEIPTVGGFPLYVDATIPPNEIHVYQGGELVLNVTNIGGG